MMKMVLPLILLFNPTYFFLFLLSGVVMSFKSENMYNSLFIMDFMSKMLLQLIFFIGVMCLYYHKNFLVNLSMASLLFLFVLDKLVWFYMLFEMSLIPILLIVMTSGNKPERVQATFYFMFYAMVGSMPLLFKMTQKIKKKFSKLVPKKSWQETIFWLMSFLLKLPVYGGHLWLPKAHVESPGVGSMMLAALLLKMGAIGIFRLKMKIKYKLLTSFLIMNLFLVTFICFRLQDIKVLIAYSSVSHMGLLILMIFSFVNLNFWGGCIFCVAHGYISSLMFKLITKMYFKSGTRSILLNTSGAMFSSTLFFFWSTACMFKAGTPPNISFFSEILMISSLSNYNNWMFLLMLTLLLIGLFKILLLLFFSHKKSLKMKKIVTFIHKKNLQFTHFVFISFSIFFFMFI